MWKAEHIVSEPVPSAPNETVPRSGEVFLLMFCAAKLITDPSRGIVVLCLVGDFWRLDKYSTYCVLTEMATFGLQLVDYNFDDVMRSRAHSFGV